MCSQTIWVLFQRGTALMKSTSLHWRADDTSTLSVSLFCGASRFLFACFCSWRSWVVRHHRLKVNRWFKEDAHLIENAANARKTPAFFNRVLFFLLRFWYVRILPSCFSGSVCWANRVVLSGTGRVVGSTDDGWPTRLQPKQTPFSFLFSTFFPISFKCHMFLHGRLSALQHSPLPSRLRCWGSRRCR